MLSQARSELVKQQVGISQYLYQQASATNLCPDAICQALSTLAFIHFVLQANKLKKTDQSNLGKCLLECNKNHLLTEWQSEDICQTLPTSSCNKLSDHWPLLTDQECYSSICSQTTAARYTLLRFDSWPLVRFTCGPLRRHTWVDEWSTSWT